MGWDLCLWGEGMSIFGRNAILIGGKDECMYERNKCLSRRQKERIEVVNVL
jgi:hypothetical protein